MMFNDIQKSEQNLYNCIYYNLYPYSQEAIKQQDV